MPTVKLLLIKLLNTLSSHDSDTAVPSYMESYTVLEKILMVYRKLSTVLINSMYESIMAFNSTIDE